MSAFHQRAFGRRPRVRTGAVQTSAPLTAAQRATLERSVGELDALVRALAINIGTANLKATATGVLIPPLGIYRDAVIPVAEVERLLDDGLYQWDRNKPVMLQAAQAGSVTNPTTGEKRQATARDGEAFMRVLGRTAEYFEQLSALSEAFAPVALVRDLFARTTLRLAELAAEIWEALEALFKGVKNTGKTIGFLLPMLALGGLGLAAWSRSR